MLTSSKNEDDVMKTYQWGGDELYSKTGGLRFFAVVDGFNFYWNIINKYRRILKFYPGRREPPMSRNSLFRRGGHNEILVIDDNPQDRKIVKRYLTVLP